MRLPTRLCLLATWLVLPGVLHGESTDQFGRGHALDGSGYTVVDFAASWCEPCYDALPRLSALAGEHPEVRFLVVSVDDDVEGRDRLVEDLDLGLPVIWDENHGMIERFRPKGFPATYVLNAAGEVVYHHVGYNKKKWRAFVDVVTRLESLPADDPGARGRADP